MAKEWIQKSYPWTQYPLVVGAPMGGYIASPSFAVSVSASGGLGFIGTGAASDGIPKAFEEAKALLSEAAISPGSETMPIGIGFLLFGSSLDSAAEEVKKYQPAAIWLFAATSTSQYETWTVKMREASPKSHIWIQIGCVADAVDIAQTCSPDVIVCQGADAGGHGLQKSAGIISLLPEVADALQYKGFGSIPLVATGGIADGRGVAAAVALGAVGAAMGTRFLASNEVRLSEKGYQDAIIAASDGGNATVRDKVFDDLHPKGNIWPPAYDGRAFRNLSWKDKQSGLHVDGIRKIKEAESEKEETPTDVVESHVTLWAGSGVGLVKKVQPAAEIVEEVRNQAASIMAAL